LKTKLDDEDFEIHIINSFFTFQDEDDDFEEEEFEDWDDDEMQDDDTSWRVRRASLKVVVAMLKAMPNKTTELSDHFTQVLITR
jgi:hypothetical protein